MLQHSHAPITNLTPPCGYTADALASKSHAATPSTSTTYQTFVKQFYSSITAWWATPCYNKPEEHLWVPPPAQPFVTWWWLYASNLGLTHTATLPTTQNIASQSSLHSVASLPPGTSTTDSPSFPPAPHTSRIFQFLSPHFYGAPIFLETEPGLDYLGFTINPSQHSIHYKATANLTDILSPQSASPDIVLRSSFRARAILARRLATPQEAVAQAMEQLSEVYKTAGYDQSWIQELRKESILFAGARTHFPQISCRMSAFVTLCCSFCHSIRVTCIVGEANSSPYTKSCRDHRLELPENL